MKKFLFLILLFPLTILAENPVISNYKIKPSVSYSFITSGSRSYFLQQYKLNLVNRHDSKLKTNFSLSYFQINKNSFIAPELNMTYSLNKNTKFFLNIQLMKPLNNDSTLFSPYRNFDYIDQWK